MTSFFSTELVVQYLLDRAYLLLFLLRYIIFFKELRVFPPLPLSMQPWNKGQVSVCTLIFRLELSLHVWGGHHVMSDWSKTLMVLNLMLTTLELKYVFKLTMLMSYEHFYLQGKIVFDLEYSRISNRINNLVLGIKSLFTSQIKSLSPNSSRLNKSQWVYIYIRSLVVRLFWVQNIKGSNPEMSRKEGLKEIN